MGTQRYSPQFKQTVVEELLAGAKRPGPMCRAQGIDFATLRKWREQYAPHGLRAWSTPAAKTVPSAEDRIAHLHGVAHRRAGLVPGHGFSVHQMPRAAWPSSRAPASSAALCAIAWP